MQAMSISLVITNNSNSSVLLISDLAFKEVLRSRMRNKRKEYFVKWLGYPDKFNYWVPAESVKYIK
jgi:AAA+ superfamily predicted ATPase